MGMNSSKDRSAKDCLKCGEAANEGMLKLESLTSCIRSEMWTPKLETACAFVLCNGVQF